MTNASPSVPRALSRSLRSLLIPVLALALALCLGAIIMYISGDNPCAAYQGLFAGAFGDGRAWATTIRRMTPWAPASPAASMLRTR